VHRPQAAGVGEGPLGLQPPDHLHHAVAAFAGLQRATAGGGGWKERRRRVERQAGGLVDHDALPKVRDHAERRAAAAAGRPAAGRRRRQGAA